MMDSDAVISPCGNYRYMLTRTWDAGQLVPKLVFVMLNPSTADHVDDDATIRKCIGFAKRYGFGGIVVVNLFAFRSRDPKKLRSVTEPVGPDNDDWIKRATSSPFDSIIVAWGVNGKHFPERIKHVHTLIGRAVRALDITDDGHPWHPVMLGYDRVPQPWSPP